VGLRSGKLALRQKRREIRPSFVGEPHHTWSNLDSNATEDFFRFEILYIYNFSSIVSLKSLYQSFTRFTTNIQQHSTRNV